MKNIENSCSLPINLKQAPCVLIHLQYPSPIENKIKITLERPNERVKKAVITILLSSDNFDRMCYTKVDYKFRKYKHRENTHGCRRGCFLCLLKATQAIVCIVT